jgi:hypothetical protein
MKYKSDKTFEEFSDLYKNTFSIGIDDVLERSPYRYNIDISVDNNI